MKKTKKARAAIYNSPMTECMLSPLWGLGFDPPKHRHTKIKRVRNLKQIIQNAEKRETDRTKANTVKC